MHQEGHSNRARCSLELKSDTMVQDRIYDLQGTAAFSLTVFTAAGFGFGHLFVVGLLGRGFR
jgi:hypothetical protein